MQHINNSFSEESYSCGFQLDKKDLFSNDVYKDNNELSSHLLPEIKEIVPKPKPMMFEPTPSPLRLITIGASNQNNVLINDEGSYFNSCPNSEIDDEEDNDDDNQLASTIKRMKKEFNCSKKEKVQRLLSDDYIGEDDIKEESVFFNNQIIEAKEELYDNNEEEEDDDELILNINEKETKQNEKVNSILNILRGNIK